MSDEAVEVKMELKLEAVVVKVDKATDKAMKTTALGIAEQAKANIRGNNQIDTGFMVNSVYAVWEDGDTYGEANRSGQYTNRQGQAVTRELADRVDLPGDAKAATVIGANYAIYQEAQKPFLYPAAQTVAGQIGGTVERVYREELDE